MPTLADLIQRRKAARGWSYREIAARGNDVISAQRWQQLGTGVRLREFPEPSTLAGMADALEVDVSAVLLATAKSLGLDVRRHQSELATMLPSSAGELTPDQRDAVLAVVKAMNPPQEAPHEVQGTQNTPSNSPADGETRTSRAPMKLAAVPDHDETGQDSDEPLPYDPEQLHAARDLDGMTDGERRRLPGKDAGEENQEPDNWEGA